MGKKPEQSSAAFKIKSFRLIRRYFIGSRSFKRENITHEKVVRNVLNYLYGKYLVKLQVLDSS